MSVEIDPLELGFRRPFTVEVAQVLKIKNTNTSPVAFKVKTTAPKQYCVRPNSGRIEPGHEVEVSVLLQAMKQEPPVDQKCRDKFLVQSVTITADKEFTNVQQIWDTVERSAIQEKKIRVSWLPSTGDDHPAVAATPIRESLTNGVEATPDVQPPSYQSPHENTVIQKSPTPVEEPEVKQESTQEPEMAPSTIPVPTVETIKATAAETVEELKDKLAKAEAQIASLKDQATSGLRQRLPVAKSDEKSAASTQALAQAQAQGTEGVPIQITAILCLISFLLAYIFF